MRSTNPQDLLRHYCETQDPEVLEGWVRVHTDLVYSAALRQLRRSDLAEDVTQSVFIILSKKAHTIKAGVPLEAWLLRVTRYTCIDLIRREQRRQVMERKVAEAMVNQEEGEDPWSEISPMVDEVLLDLKERDRNIIVMRFFTKLSFKEIGQRIDRSEDAARMRLNGALQRLRKIFVKRGVTVSVSLLSITLSEQAVQGAPLQLTSTINASFTVNTLSTSIQPMVQGGLSMLFKAKLKSITITTLAATLAIGGGSTIAHQAFRSTETKPHADPSTPKELASPSKKAAKDEPQRPLDLNPLEELQQESSTFQRALAELGQRMDLRNATVTRNPNGSYTFSNSEQSMELSRSSFLSTAKAISQDDPMVQNNSAYHQAIIPVIFKHINKGFQQLPESQPLNQDQVAKLLLRNQVTFIISNDQLSQLKLQLPNGKNLNLTFTPNTP